MLPGAGFASPDFPSPRLREGSIELRNTATVTGYDRVHKQADWVFYPLGPAQLHSCFERGNTFRSDPRLSAADSAELSDYSGTGLDRGHLSPAGDNKWSREAMNESFFLSNVSPQPGAFNRGIWSRLEGLVRAWAKNLGGLWVTTGPLLTGSLRTIGTSKVSVPEFFYKVVATAAPGSQGTRARAAAFLLPVNASGDLGRYELSVRRLEEITGLDFLSGLAEEDAVETSLDPSQWDLRATFSYLPCQAMSPGPFDWAWGLSAPAASLLPEVK